MKKIVSLMVLLTFLAASIFASAPAEESLRDFAVSPVENEIDLFEDVQAVPLAEVEMETVEGDGWLGALIGAAAGALIGVGLSFVYGYDIGASAAAGATTGVIIGGVFGP